MESDNTMRSYREFKKIFIFFVLIVLSVLLTGCCFQHEWTEATCTTPQTCTKCSKTEGEPLPHEWENATCTSPQTCKVCGVAQGTALGHDWIDATCTKPKTCGTCKETEGEPLGHNYGANDFVCTRCETEKIFSSFADIIREAEYDYSTFKKNYMGKVMLIRTKVEKNYPSQHWFTDKNEFMYHYHTSNLESARIGTNIDIRARLENAFTIFGVCILEFRQV